MGKQKKKQNGITLIALVISIIVMLILAGISLNATIGESGIITQAQKATLAQKYSTYKEELEMQLENEIVCSGKAMRDYISSMEDIDLKNFIIIRGELAFIGKGEIEREVADSLGIDTTLSENASVEDVITIVDKVLVLGNELEIPVNDSQLTPEGLVGKRLYDKNAENGERWDLVVDYNDSNIEKGRYGSGYYLLKAGNYNINGEIITLLNDYIVNYADNILIGLSHNYVEWSLESTLAISEGLVLNIDPTNLADGEWTGITKHGDVEYNSDTKALMFNENIVNNPTGEGGYIELTKTGVDFTDGFSFEIYANLSRLRYDNGSGKINSGLFCRIPNLSATVTQALRFGFFEFDTICKFNNSSSWYGTGNVLGTVSGGNVNTSTCGYDLEEDFYLTFVYTAYNANKPAEYQVIHYDDKMRDERSR